MDNQHRRVIGKPDQGCRHCGAINETVSGNGHVVVYTPATECCAGALLDRIQRRTDEINTLRASWERSQHPATQKQIW